MPRNPRQAAKDSNLFKIDFDAIEAVLADANSRLLEQSVELISNANRLPEKINGKDDAKKIEEVVRKIRAQIKEVSRARLSDGRPFSEASKLVKNWFDETETKLKNIEKILSNKLSKFVSFQVQKVERVRKQNEEAGINLDNLNGQEEIAVGTSVSGEPIVSVRKSDLPVGSGDIRPLPEVPDIPLNWEVKSYDRSIIPLETLRQYFAENSIRQALNKHLKDNGPNQLIGVEYVEVLGDISKKSSGQTNVKFSASAQSGRHENAGSSWTNEEDTSLSMSFNRGQSINELSTNHRRTVGAIRSRLAKLGLIEQSQNQF